MTRVQLEHIVRAAGSITDESVILVLGSQSILGAFPAVPPPSARSLCLTARLVTMPTDCRPPRALCPRAGRNASSPFETTTRGA